VEPKSLHHVDKNSEATSSPSRQPPTELESEGEKKSESEAGTQNGPPFWEAELEEPFLDACSEFETDESEPVDWEDDPLESRRTSDEPSEWTHDFFAQFFPRKPSVPDDSTLRRQIRDLLSKIEAGPPVANGKDLEDSLT
jgi:hypothetical protein